MIAEPVVPTFSSARQIINHTPTGISAHERWIPEGVSNKNPRVAKMRALISNARKVYNKANGPAAKNAIAKNFHKVYAMWYTEVNKSTRQKLANFNALKTLMAKGNKAALNALINAINKRQNNNRALNSALNNFRTKYTPVEKNKASAKAKLAVLVTRKANLESKRNALEREINEIMNQMRPLLLNLNNS